MKQITLFSLATAGLLALSPVHAATFDDVRYWVGTGAKQAALVIDWNDGSSGESLLWGYRWDGAATGLGMLEAVVNADARLFAHLGTYSWGTATLGIGYDLNNSGGFAVSPSLTFDSGGLALDTNPDDARAATDSADHFLEGWNDGFWDYYTRASSGDEWASSFVGARDRVLADGAWDAYNFEAGFAPSIPSEPTPAMVPEPSTVSLFTLGTLAFVWLRRRHA